MWFGVCDEETQYLTKASGNSSHQQQSVRKAGTMCASEILKPGQLHGTDEGDDRRTHCVHLLRKSQCAAAQYCQVRSYNGGRLDNICKV